VVPLTFLIAGRDFEFIDIDRSWLCMDPARLIERLKATDRPRVAGVVYVRTYGVANDARELFEEVKRIDSGVLLIDDRCSAIPETDVDRVDLQGADALLYSTGYAKFVDLGWGGFAHLRSSVPYSESALAYEPHDLESVTEMYKEAIRRRAPLLRHHGQLRAGRSLAECRWLDTRPPVITWDDYRSRVLEARNEATEQTQRVNAIYRRLIPEAVQLRPGFHDWRFQIVAPRRDELLHKIFAAGYFASAHYFPSSTLFGDVIAPVATDLANGILNLFNDFRVTESDATRIAEVVAEHIDSHGASEWQ
jgi:dTDP-4-amino-4,6-dideoxygalactose transaminase